jgi:hypothetical protein
MLELKVLSIEVVSRLTRTINFEFNSPAVDFPELQHLEPQHLNTSIDLPAMCQMTM